MGRIRFSNKNRKIELINCACGCGKLLNRYDNRNRVRKYHANCRGKWVKPWISNLTKGQKISLRNKGKHYSLSTEFKKGHKSWSEGLFGKDNPLYKENKVTPLKKYLRTHTLYIIWKKKIFERDNYICQICFIRGGILQVDHYPKTFLDIILDNSIQNIEEAINCFELWDISNGRTIHESCHKKTSTYGYKAVLNRKERGLKF